MTKEEAIAGQTLLQKLTVEQVKELKQMSPSDLQVEIPYLQAKLTDNLWLQTGIEMDDLIYCSEKHEIYDDPAFKKQLEEHNETINNLQK